MAIDVETPGTRLAGLHTLESATVTLPLDPAMARATKEFRIAEIRMEIAKLTFEKSQLRAEIARS